MKDHGKDGFLDPFPACLDRKGWFVIMCIIGYEKRNEEGKVECSEKKHDRAELRIGEQGIPMKW